MTMFYEGFKIFTFGLRRVLLSTESDPKMGIVVLPLPGQ